MSLIGPISIWSPWWDVNVRVFLQCGSALSLRDSRGSHGTPFWGSNQKSEFLWTVSQSIDWLLDLTNSNAEKFIFPYLFIGTNEWLAHAYGTVIQIQTKDSNYQEINHLRKKYDFGLSDGSGYLQLEYCFCFYSVRIDVILDSKWK